MLPLILGRSALQHYLIVCLQIPPSNSPFFLQKPRPQLTLPVHSDFCLSCWLMFLCSLPSVSRHLLSYLLDLDCKFFQSRAFCSVFVQCPAQQCLGPWVGRWDPGIIWLIHYNKIIRGISVVGWDEEKEVYKVSIDRPWPSAVLENCWQLICITAVLPLSEFILGTSLKVAMVQVWWNTKVT